jgi:signal peptide peptidase SppA
MTRDAHVLGFALDHPWAIEESWLAIIASILGRHAAGQAVDDATLQAALVQRKNLPQPPGGGVAVIPVYGVIAPRLNALSSMSGGTSYAQLSEQLAAAVADPKVKTIVFDVDSPGGSVAGAPEFAAEVRAARATKPIIAQAQFKMGSSAYWLSASATKIYAAPSALVGSIGVYTIHDEISKALAEKGVTRTYISAGKYKVDGNEVTPLTDEIMARMRVPVDAAYGQFVGDISKGRGIPVDQVRTGYGEGRAVTAADALTFGMIDGIATLDETIARAFDGERVPTSLAAHDTVQELSQATTQDRLRAQQQEFELALL